MGSFHLSLTFQSCTRQHLPAFLPNCCSLKHPCMFLPPGHCSCVLWLLEPLQPHFCWLKSLKTRFHDHLFLVPPFHNGVCSLLPEHSHSFWPFLALASLSHGSARLNKWGCTLGTWLLTHTDQLWTQDGPLVNFRSRTNHILLALLLGLWGNVSWGCHEQIFFLISKIIGNTWLKLSYKIMHCVCMYACECMYVYMCI